MLFELLTGRKPHTGDTPIQVAYAHVNSDVPAPSTFPHRRPIPPYLDALVVRATSRNASRRPRDARVLLSELRRVQAALRGGVADDPDLLRAHLTPPPTRDRADYEVTQLVTASVPAPPPTVLEAPAAGSAGASAAAPSDRAARTSTGIGWPVGAVAGWSHWCWYSCWPPWRLWRAGT